MFSRVRSDPDREIVPVIELTGRSRPDLQTTKREETPW
jgi:hypothetical protein